MIQGPRLIFWSFFLSGFLAGVSVFGVISPIWGKLQNKGWVPFSFWRIQGAEERLILGLVIYVFADFRGFLAPIPFCSK